MFARENRAPADLVFGIPRTESSTSYDDCSPEMEKRQRAAYQLVRQHLGITAERMKRRYDLRVRPQQFRKGQWILSFNPRKKQGRQQKWESRYSPHLIIEEFPPVNYLIQNTNRLKPFISHIDNIDTDNPPKSWLPDQPNDDTKVRVPVPTNDDGMQSMANEEHSRSAAENNVTSFNSCPPQMDDNTQSDNESTENRVPTDEQESAIVGSSSTPRKRFRPPRTSRRPVRYPQ